MYKLLKKTFSNDYINSIHSKYYKNNERNVNQGITKKECLAYRLLYTGKHVTKEYIAKKISFNQNTSNTRQAYDKQLKKYNLKFFNYLHNDIINNYSKLVNSSNTDISFWDIKDNRIDSLFADLSENILKCIKNELNTCDITNWGLLSDEDKTIYSEKYINKFQKRYITDAEEVFDEAQNIPVERVVRYQYAPPVTTQTIQANINIDDLNDQVQETVYNITNKYLYRENTPQVREDLLDELNTIFGGDVYLE